QEDRIEVDVAGKGDPARVHDAGVDDLELALDGGVAAEGGGAGGGARRPRQVLQLLEHLDVHEEAAVVGRLDQGDGAGADGLERGQQALRQVRAARPPR